MKTFVHRISIGCLSCSILVLAGCASPARTENMAVHQSVSRTQNMELRGKVTVLEVTGGTDTNPMWMSKVSSSAFHQALEDSLRAAGLMDAVGARGQYQLTADLLSLNQPTFGGFDMTVGSSVRYSLVERSTRKEIFSKVIQADYTAAFSESFLGSTRLQLANEGAIRKNITKLIDELNGLRIQRQ